MTSQILLRILGAPEVSGGPPGSPFPAKAFQLLALVCRTAGGRISRRKAASLLWDSASDGDALTNLRQLLARIRRFAPFAAELIAADTLWVSLGPRAAAIDLVQFETLTATGGEQGLLDGLALFRGDLLAGAGDCTEEFAQWLRQERAALRTQFFSVAAAALIDLTRFGRASAEDLRRIARQVLALEPEREASYRLLIEAYGRNSMFAEAGQLLNDLKEVLRREFDAAPSADTLGLARRVMAQSATAQGAMVQSSMAQGVLAEEPMPASRQDARPRIAFMAPYSTEAQAAPRIVRALIEDVANELTRYRTFAVLAPHSSFQVAHDSGLPLDNAMLRADYTVSGFLRRDAGTQSLTLRLVKSESAEIVWAIEIPVDAGRLAGSFRILAMRVAASLAAELERDSLAGSLRKDRSSEAYRSYLEGQIELDNCALPQLRRAQRAFRDAAEGDPGFAAARARIAQTLQLEWLLLGGSDPQLLEEARRQSEAAIAIDGGAALGHWMNGVIGLYQRDYDLVAEKFEAAESLSPNSADLLVQHADALSHLGRPEDGWLRFERALELNPLPPDHYWWAGASIAFNQEDFRRSIALCGRMQSDEPVLRLLTASHALAGELATARAYGRRLLETYPGARAAEIVQLAPNRDPRPKARFLEGLRLAGIP